MSKEIRRLHRKKVEFTNFSGNEAPKQTVEKRSRRGRRSGDSINAINNDSTVSDSVELLSKNTEDNNLESAFSAESLAMASSVPIGANDIDSIRADLLEDISHSQVADADYSDDPYDWGGNSQDISDDYLYFLRSFE